MKYILFILMGLLSFQVYAKKFADVGTQKEAQAWYEQQNKSGQTSWESLDKDGDGKACDCLPSGNGKNCPKNKK